MTDSDLLEEFRFPDRNETLLPTDSSQRSNTRAYDKTVRVVPKTSAELGGKSRPVLHQFYPAWDVQAYIRFGGIQLHIVNSSYPEYEATGQLPQLNDGHFLVPKDEIISHLQTYYKDLDDSLTDAQRAYSIAFSAIVQGNLQQVAQYCKWVDPITYKEVSRPALLQVMPFPLNRLLPKYYHARITNSEIGSLSKEQVYILARDSYVALNSRLEASDGPFFFGSRPTSIDAIVFGHLVDALSDGQLREVLGAHGPLLIQHATHIRETYFESQAHAALCTQDRPNSFASVKSAFMAGFHLVPHASFVQPFQSLSWSKREVVKAAKVEHDADAEEAVVTYEKSTRNIIFGGLLAIILYTVSQFSISIEDDEDDEEYGDEYDDDDA